jgi:hypothetical protein
MLDKLLALPPGTASATTHRPGGTTSECGYAASVQLLIFPFRISQVSVARSTGTRKKTYSGSSRADFDTPTPECCVEGTVNLSEGCAVYCQPQETEVAAMAFARCVERNTEVSVLGVRCNGVASAGSFTSPNGVAGVVAALWLGVLGLRWIL